VKKNAIKEGNIMCSILMNVLNLVIHANELS